MTIQELIQKPKHFVFYDANRERFTWYEYLCPFPMKNPKYENVYHIIINKRTEEPERIYRDRLQEILDKGLDSFEKCRDYQIRLVEDHLNSLKNED